MHDRTLPPLDPRLAALAALVPEDARVADIGCDHALLAVHLAATGRATAVIATDVDDEALARARRPPADAPWSRRIAYRAGRGLAPLRAADALDTVVLAGIGGRTIATILDAGELDALGIRRLVIQPAADAAAVRRRLTDLAWTIVDERVAADGRRLHEIVVAERGHASSEPVPDGLEADDLIEAGPVLLRRGGPEVREIWERQRARLERIVASEARGPAIDAARRGLARARRILAFLGC